MRRPYPNRRRKRKERPPPLGLKTIYDWVLPKSGIHNRRRHFNQLGSSIVLGMGLFGAVLGFAMAGPVGAVLGGAGPAPGDHSLRRHRFIR